MDDGLEERRIHTLLHEEGRFLGFLRSRVGSLEVSEDILQSAYLRSLEKGSQVRDDENIVSWFYTLLRHAIADHFRSTRPQTMDPSLLDGIPAAEDPELRRSSEDCVRVAMRNLNPEEAELIGWVDLSGIPVAEVAQWRSESPKALSKHLFRARQNLRKHLQELCRSCTATKCLYCKCPAEPGLTDETLGL